LTTALNLPGLSVTCVIQKFLHEQLNNSESSVLSALSLNDSDFDLPPFKEKLSIYTSAVAMFHAPSDTCGVGGMRFECIHAINDWQNEGPHYDCVFVETDPDAEGMLGLDVARVHQFFSFTYQDVLYPCALVCWFSWIGDQPDGDMGMWKVEPDFLEDGTPYFAVIHLDSVVRAAHLLGEFPGDEFIPEGIPVCAMLDILRSFYVNKLIDYHAFEIAF